MTYIPHSGSPESRIWCLLERPYSSDSLKGELCSGGIGFAFKQMMKETGLASEKVFFCSRRPDLENANSFSSVDSLLVTYKPPFILAVGEAASSLLMELRPKEGQDNWRTQLNKYVGSLLQSPSCSSWPHYIMPLADPADLMKDWRERNVTTYIDLAKIKEELEFYQNSNGTLKPLLSRHLVFHEMDTEEILSYLDSFRSEPRLSEDIETVYPKKNSEYYGEHPGVPITFGIAPSSKLGISFSIFRKSTSESKAVWRAMARLHEGCSMVIGQNFFNFDSFFYSLMGFKLNRSTFQDTLIRHHILWPELPHKLQFLTRQYTRQPYYKDEGRTWSPKNMTGLRHYNCLDATVTFEVYEEQEKEFDLRPYLR